LALACCFALLACAGSAFGAVRYAAPGAGGAEPCNPNPCALVKAVNFAKAGDQIVIAEGQYQVSTDLVLDEAVDVGGKPGARPAIGLLEATIRITAPGALLHDVSAFLTEEYMGYPLVQEAGTVERVFSSGKNGGAACVVQSGLMRDSVCFDGLDVHPFGAAGVRKVTLRNVTALGMSIGAHDGAMLTLDAANVIARSIESGNKDIEVNVGADAQMTATFVNSNYATVGTTLSAGDDFTYTAPGAGSNQTAPPQFVDPSANDYRPLPSSPTIDAGLADGQLGAFGLNGEGRSLPRCVGGTPIPDIGAYEFVPTEACPKPPNGFRFGKLKRLKAKGTATLAVAVPGPGTVALAGKGLRARKARAVAGPGTVNLALAAKGKWKRALVRKGSVKLGAKVTFVPTGGDPKTVVRKVKLVLKRP